jgi:hypothetical protein
MNSLPAEIFGLFGDYLDDVRGLALTCTWLWNEFRHRPDVVFWRSDPPTRAAIAPPKMYHFCGNIPVATIVEFGSFDLITSFARNHIDDLTRNDALAAACRRMDDDIFDFVFDLWENTPSSEPDDITDPVKICCQHDYLHGVKSLIKYSYDLQSAILAYNAIKCAAFVADGGWQW